MKVDVLTLFPGMFTGPLDESIVKRARASGRLELAVHNLRDWTHDRHRTVDDKPFGGGPGMLLKPEPVFEAVEALTNERTTVVLLTPSGRMFDQSVARELAERRLESEQKKYDLGASTIRFVLEEQRNVAQAQSNHIAALINYTKALADLDRAMGMTLKKNNVQVDKTLAAPAAAK